MVIHVHKTSKYGDGVKKVKIKSTSGKTAYNGKGVSACYLDYQYHVLKFYK